MLKKGDKIPNFQLFGIDESGQEINYDNRSFLNKKLIIYFYPKDDTPGCTKESCAFNSLYPQIKDRSNIVGISADSIDSHRNFQKKYNLIFPLLTDKDLSFAQSMDAVKTGVLGKLKIMRSTFLFDEEGVLIRAWYNVKVSGHDQEILNELNLATHT